MKLDLTWLDWTLLALAAFLLWNFPKLLEMRHEAKQWRAISGTVR